MPGDMHEGSLGGSLTVLGPDIRTMIYEQVFGNAVYVKLSTPDHISITLVNDNDFETAVPITEINTELFRVNHFIYREATDLFYTMKIIRASFYQIRTFLAQPNTCQCLRNLQIIQCNQFSGRSDVVPTVLRACLALPRIRTVAILTDCLGDIDDMSPFTTVRQLTERYLLGNVTCTDIGRYKLQGEFAEVALFNPKVLKLWPRVTSTPDDFDAYRAAWGVMEHWGAVQVVRQALVWASHTSIRIWAGLHDLCKRQAQEPGFRVQDSRRPVAVAEGVTFLDGFQEGIMCDDNVPLFHRGRHAHLPLRRLRPGHDPQSLEDASELLAFNLEVYRRSVGHPIPAPIRRAIWSELYGEECEGVARARWEQVLQVTRSVNRVGSAARDEMQHGMPEGSLFVRLFGRDAFALANRLDLSKMRYFCLAFTVAPREFRSHVHERRSFEYGTSRLFRQYFAAAGAIDMATSQPMPRFLLQDLMEQALDLIRDVEVEYEDFAGFDPAYPDVYPPFLRRLAPALRQVALRFRTR